MESSQRYAIFLRNRISELIAQRGISEHRLSLELGKSGSYIRAITNGLTLPSVKELFNIINYFEMDPSEFFAGLADDKSLRAQINAEIRELDEEDLEKVRLFITWIKK